jgi:cytoskeletal protein CcmA (bactofilin family)
MLVPNYAEDTMRLGRVRHNPASAPRESEPGRDVSVLGPELMVVGQLESAGEIQVHGSIAGDIHASKVTLCQGSKVEGNLVAREALIGGRLNGRIFAPIVVVEETGAVVGRIFHNEITVAKGGFVDGRMPWRPINHFDKSATSVEELTSEHVHEKRSGS